MNCLITVQIISLIVTFLSQTEAFSTNSKGE